MMEPPRTLQIAGLDAIGQCLAQSRWEALRSFFTTLAGADPRWDAAFLADDRALLSSLFAACEAQAPLAAPHNFLLPLADTLGLSAATEEHLLAAWWRRGLLDLPSAGGWRRPAIVDALRESLLVFRPGAASTIADEWMRRERTATSLARAIILAYCAHGPLGLLTQSDYPYVSTLLLAESQLAPLHLTDGGQSVVGQVRADLIALQTAWPISNALSWSDDLLHAPPHSPFRQHTATAFAGSHGVTLVSRLVGRQGYSTEAATQLMSTIVNYGVAGLIAWRSADRRELEVERQHHRRLLDTCWYGLHPAARVDIEAQLAHVHAAAVEAQVPFSLAPLIQDYP